jgi:hypothetical protein
MRLVELEPRLIRREILPCHVGAPGCITISDHAEHEWYVPVDRIEDADGIMFLCPKCFADNGGAIGTHSVICWRPRVPPEVKPAPGRWEMQGTSIDDLSLVAGSSSVQLTAGCFAHFLVERGGIRMAP